MKEYIKVCDLHKNHLYKISARNASYGVWLGQKKGSFAISRIKWERNFIDEEIYWDLNSHFGTAKPIEDMGLVFFKNDKEMLDLLNRYEINLLIKQTLDTPPNLGRWEWVWKAIESRK